MKINVTNTEKIQQEIDNVQADCRQRTINAQQVEMYAKMLEERLEVRGIPKKLRVGFRFWVNPNAQNFPNAYKWVPMSTNFMLERFPSGWFVMAIMREYCSNKRISLKSVLTEEQKEAIIKKFCEF
jgi:hypothetical protein